MNKHEKEIQKLRSENNSLWEQNQKLTKSLQAIQNKDNRNNELQGEAMMLNKSIIQLKNKEVQYVAVIEELERQNSIYKSAIDFYANTSSWKILLDDSGGEYALISRSDEEIVDGRIKAGRRARQCLKEIEK